MTARAAHNHTWLPCIDFLQYSSLVLRLLSPFYLLRGQEREPGILCLRMPQKSVQPAALPMLFLLVSLSPYYSSLGGYLMCLCRKTNTKQRSWVVEFWRDVLVWPLFRNWLVKILSYLYPPSSRWPLHASCRPASHASGLHHMHCCQHSHEKINYHPHSFFVSVIPL